MTKKVLISLVALLIVAIASVSYLFWSRRPVGAPAQSKVATTQTVATATPQTAATTTTSHSGMKLYRNDQYGFEFWYPAGWVLETNSYHSPNSKFNLTANPGGNYMAFGVNIATDAYTKSVITGMDAPMDATSTIPINGVPYLKDEYQFEGEAVDMIFMTHNHENILVSGHPAHIPNLTQIFQSFRFFSTTTASTAP